MEEMEDGFWQEVVQYEEEKKMAYVTTGERIGYRRGKREGLLEAIEMGLSIKFGDKGPRFLPTIQAMDGIERLVVVKEAILRICYSPAGRKRAPYSSRQLQGSSRRSEI